MPARLAVLILLAVLDCALHDAPPLSGAGLQELRGEGCSDTPLRGLTRLRGGRDHAQEHETRRSNSQRAQGKRGRKSARGKTRGEPAGLSSDLTALKETLRAKLTKKQHPMGAPLGTKEKVLDSDGEDSGLLAVDKKKKVRQGSFQALGLDDTLVRGMYHAGYKFPTPVQRKVIPHVLSGRHVVAMARTG